MSFGDILRSFRTSRGYTQMKLAEALGFSQTSIASWESGTREPDFSTIKRIAEYFHVPMAVFFAQEEPMPDEYVLMVADCFSKNPKLRLPFNKLQLFSENDLDAVIAIVNIMSKEHERN